MEEMKENLDIRYTRIYDRIFEMRYPEMQAAAKVFPVPTPP